MQKKTKIWLSLILVIILIIIISVIVNISKPNDLEVVETGTIQDPFLGPADSKIVVIEYSDFECPFCGAVAGTNEYLIGRLKQNNPSWIAPVPKLKELAKAGKIKYIFKDYPLPGHPDALPASMAAQCAHEQGKFWEYHDLLFENQEKLSIKDLKKYAEDLKLDTTKFNSCLDNKKYNLDIKKDQSAGAAQGVDGTPTFFINGKIISGAESFSAFEPLLK
ncbi:MAG TPA: thioredoxin domain-containing protein [Candidatus Nanoarchaeia archaeon]|nr:thioredoxin domain-containing protein [Candidatus Nanoarchaeia archaeon]